MKETKQCKCGKELPLEEFPFKNKAKGIRHNICKHCQRELNRQHYQKNKQSYLNRNKVRRSELQEWFSNFKKTLSCVKCGESRWWVLDFHHRDPNEKDQYVATLASWGHKKALEKEIEKCDVLCANCHRDVHYQIDN